MRRDLATLSVSAIADRRRPRYFLNNLVERTLSGLKATSTELIRQLKLGQPLGKLLPTLRWQHVSDRDGLQGRPLWAAIGKTVYDISGKKEVGKLTRYTADTNIWTIDMGDERVRDLIRSSGGRVPTREIAALEGINIHALLKGITEVKCARLAEAVHAEGPESNREMIFTEKEVACYVYPEEGIYTIIRGDVYDMTGKHSYLKYNEKMAILSDNMS